jgi:hypothetical protein
MHAYALNTSELQPFGESLDLERACYDGSKVGADERVTYGGLVLTGS